jgi:hypothetical protein
MQGSVLKVVVCSLTCLMLCPQQVVGSCAELGGWSVEDGLLMSWTPGHIWVAEMVLPPGEGPWVGLDPQSIHSIPVLCTCLCHMSIMVHMLRSVFVQGGDVGVSSCMIWVRAQCDVVSLHQTHVFLQGATSLRLWCTTRTRELCAGRRDQTMCWRWGPTL